MPSSRARILLVVIVLAGCATGRRSVRVAVPAVANADDGVVVRIESVRDARVFHVGINGPHTTAGVHSPATRKREVDPATTSRLIGRILNHDMMAMGEVVLEPGTTVERVVKDVVSNGLKASGYRVLGRTGQGDADAVPLDVEISRFWMWTGATNYLDVRLVVRGPVEPFLDGVEILSSTESPGPLVTASGRFQQSLDAGIAGLLRDVETRLRDAREGKRTGEDEAILDPADEAVSKRGEREVPEPSESARSWCDPGSEIAVWIRNEYQAVDVANRRDARRVSAVANRVEPLGRELSATLEREGIRIGRSADAVAATLVVGLKRMDYPSELARFFYIRKTVHSVEAVLELHDGNVVEPLARGERRVPRASWTAAPWSVEFDPDDRAEDLGEQALAWRRSECGP